MSPFSKVTASFVLAAATAHVQARAQAATMITGSGAAGEISQSISLGQGQAALLSGFQVSFNPGEDHHLTTLKVMPNTSSTLVNVGFRDKNGDDRFSYKAMFEAVPRSQLIINEVSGSCRRQCTSPVPVPQGYQFAIQGFEFTFRSADHHIKTVGIEHRSGQLQVYYADKNGDDLFSYRVRYALVPAGLIASSQPGLSGNDVARGSALITQGRTILNGFMLHFGSDDHQINTVALVPDGNRLNVSYYDKNWDDSISWRASVATLR